MPSGLSDANWQQRQSFPPEVMPVWLSSIVDELLEVRVPPRKGRFGPRGVKRKMSVYPIRRSRGPTKVRSPKEIHKKRIK